MKMRGGLSGFCIRSIMQGDLCFDFHLICEMNPAVSWNLPDFHTHIPSFQRS